MLSGFKAVRNILCALLILQLPLAHARKPLPASTSKGKYNIPEEYTQWNRRQKFLIKPQHLFPIVYLEQNPQQKGLVICHTMGSGKTLLGIGFAKRNPNCPIIILAPGFLEAHWREHLDKCGVEDKSRYRFFSHDDPQALLKEDLSEAIVILDESHQWISAVRNQSHENPAYSELYYKLRKAHRILALTGTIIYKDMMDFVYHLNLVSGKDLLPFNREEFRLDFSKIHKWNAYWRGYLWETALPLTTAALTAGYSSVFFNPYVGLSVLLGSSLYSLSNPVPIAKHPGRIFDIEKLKAIISQYISYYDFEHDTHVYPTRSFAKNLLSYNNHQLKFLYQLYDSRLSNQELTQLLKDSDSLHKELKTNSKFTITLNTSALQDAFKKVLGAGREIGNLSFVEKQGIHRKTIFPDKFKRIVDTIQKSSGPVVIYSHYYHNGLLLFKQFLDENGYRRQYRIYHPDMPKAQHSQIVKEFNKNQIKILLLHPKVIEGVSLQGAQQVHFLEMPVNVALKEQVIGRAIRYGSHLHLPKHKRHVSVFTWEYGIAWWDFNTSAVLRKNWHRYFAEMNFYSGERGRKEIDLNASLKTQLPDTRAYGYLNDLSKNIELLNAFIKQFSIENTDQ